MTTSGSAPRHWAVAALLLTMTACGSGQTNQVGTPVTQPVTQAGDSGGQAFSLYTHCGIDELRFAGRFYERVGGPLDDGSGNPPKGWDNPYQAGLLSRDGNVLVFTDDQGHREQFKLRSGASDFKHICD